MLLGASYHLSNKKKNQRAQTSTSGRFVIIAKRSRLSLRGFARMCWMCWMNLSFQKPNRASQKFSTTRCTCKQGYYHRTNPTGKGTDKSHRSGREIITVTWLSLHQAKSARSLQLPLTKHTRYGINDVLRCLFVFNFRARMLRMSPRPSLPQPTLSVWVSHLISQCSTTRS